LIVPLHFAASNLGGKGAITSAASLTPAAVAIDANAIAASSIVVFILEGDRMKSLLGSPRLTILLIGHLFMVHTRITP
jgi:hypothetical protein